MFKATGIVVRRAGCAYVAVGCEGNYSGSMNAFCLWKFRQDITQQMTERPAR